MEAETSPLPFSPPSTGFIDLHSHLLPGIDDGCKSVEDSLACIATLKANGFVATVCTPHIWLEEFPENHPANIRLWVEKLQEQINEVGVDYPLWPGGEVRLANTTTKWFEKYGVPTLGPTNWVLVDYWGYEWPRFADKTLDYLLARGFKPILAHPERMNFQDHELNAVLDHLREMGVWLQGNLNSMSGGEGTQAQMRMKHYLRNDKYNLIATDMHRPTDMTGRMNGIRHLGEFVGDDSLQHLLDRRPREILSLGNE